MLLPLRYPRFWLAVGWLLIVAAIVSSLVPAQKLPNIGASDKLEHMAAYALIALWFSGIYPKSRYVLIGVCLFALGVAIEWAQGAMALGREADLRDMLANATGIAAGLIIALLGLGGWAQRVEALVRKR